MNASSIKDLHYDIFETSLKTARALRRVQFERTFQISRVFKRLLIYYLTERNASERSSIKN